MRTLVVAQIARKEEWIRQVDCPERQLCNTFFDFNAPLGFPSTSAENSISNLPK